MSRPLIRRLLAAGLTVLLAATATACSSSGDTYQVTARFPEAIALYEGSDVRVMGVVIGTVTDVEIDGDAIEVTMEIDDDAPLPADVFASILPVSLIGERVINFTPAWKPGDERLAPGAAIPTERAIIPVEPDQALASITELLTSLKPESVARILSEGAAALDGNGATINATLLELSQLIPYLAQQDDEFRALSEDIGVLADVVRARDDEIAQLLEDFATVSTAIAEERDQIVGFVEALASLSRQGRALLTAYETTIPEDLDVLGEVALTIQANADSVEETLLAFTGVQSGVIDAYVPERGTIAVRIGGSESVIQQLLPLFEALQGGG